ncbi:Wadjet anti-phage system protein JetD domain-containing protein [Azospirillum brasilense]|uniref:Wadjet anti-phage system protein JetD domain-containing protein n=1 Tax=Azospirillum brasilense TaxID=192 RepID=UPI0015863F5A|nr:Wadjet anti-phage system protein JetD domain-containing protein [Azospirillum brasilense]
MGDVDAGGARIAGHLEDSLGVEVVPHLMDPATVRRFGRTGRTADVTGLSRRSGAAGAIARTIIETGLLLEQEAVDPRPLCEVP